MLKNKEFLIRRGSIGLSIEVKLCWYHSLAAGLYAVGLMILGAGAVFGQDYPNKPIRIITAVAGGGSDFIARLIGQEISGQMGQPVIVDNRGSAILAAALVSKAPPDGYTLLVSGSLLWITPLLRKVPYDTVTDFSPISQLSREVYVITVHPSIPAKTVKELIALAKAKPGELNYSSATAGGDIHLALELLKSMAGINIVGVPYKGGAAAMTALISGEVQVMALDAGLVAPHVKMGEMRALAVTSATPSALAPGLPTVSAAGVPGYELVGSTGIWAPARTSAAIVNRLHQAIVRVLGRPNSTERLLGAGEEIIASSPEQFAGTIRSEIIKMSKVIKDAGISIN